MEKIKLTKAQKRFLNALHLESEPKTIRMLEQRTIVSLKNKGFVEIVDHCKVSLTQKGRDYLSNIKN